MLAYCDLFSNLNEFDSMISEYGNRSCLFVALDEIIFLICIVTLGFYSKYVSVS